MNLHLRSLIIFLLIFSSQIMQANSYALETDSARENEIQKPVKESPLSSWDEIRRLILLQDYNTRIVVTGTTLLGLAAGMVGSFTLLRKRALMGDALSHATLPGICIAFILATQTGYEGKSLYVLLVGATISGLLGVAAILTLSDQTKLKEDTALGAVLSVFFGAGIALLGIIQNMKSGHAAGLESFIYGKTASMGSQDIQLISLAAVITIVLSLLLFKELKLLCFDEGFANSRGYPVILLDTILMAMVVMITIVGLQAVGLVLMIALLVIPAAASRFWTEKLWSMFIISGIIGLVSSFVGSGISGLFAKLPSGPMIVLICTSFFIFSLILGTQRGILIKTLRRLQLNRNVDRQHLLRGIYEILESNYQPEEKFDELGEISFQKLLTLRSWSATRLKKAVERAQSERLIESIGDKINLTKRGLIEAKRLTHQHRLWELYLMTHADIAPSRVDREADAIEHVLEPEVIMELEELLKKEETSFISSPHQIESKAAVINNKPGSQLEGNFHAG